MFSKEPPASINFQPNTKPGEVIPKHALDRMVTDGMAKVSAPTPTAQPPAKAEPAPTPTAQPPAK